MNPFSIALVLMLAAGSDPAPAREDPPPLTQTEPEASRTLEDVTIEGEIDAPEVLFITAREPRRYRDGLYRLYLPRGIDLAGRTAVPTRLKIQKPESEEE